MAAILSLKRWERVAYEAAPGALIHMKLKRLKRHEAKPLARVLIACFEQYEKAGSQDLTPMQTAAALSRVYEQIPEDQLKAWFAECVKDVEGLEIDEQPVTGGADLLDNADDALLFWLLLRLQQLSRLSGGESNASASPSGSSPVVGVAAGSSPAGSIASEAGQLPSTATEIPSTRASSTDPA